MPLSVMAVTQRNAVVGGTAEAMHRLDTETCCPSCAAAFKSSRISHAGSAKRSGGKNLSRNRRSLMSSRKFKGVARTLVSGVLRAVFDRYESQWASLGV